jgi:uncharacterized sodium:solute symporter family permease YidK
MTPLNIIGYTILIVLLAYILGRAFTKGGIHEIENFLNKKYDKFKNDKDNGTKEKE